ncbi:MAG: uroporphyrinogen-III synthase [Candidatus Sedimenticola endophacoides]
MSHAGSQAPCELGGAGVLVTRAAHQAGGLSELISRHGGRPVEFPAVCIAGPEEPDRVRALLGRLASYHTLLFISPNAVQYTLRLIDGGALPPGVRIGAVGKGTARALARAGVAVDIVPEGRFDSEALLATPALAQVARQRILIVRGRGGRALLGDTLSARGARVEYAEVYRRLCPGTPPGALLRRWSRDIDLVTVTSAEILDNLRRMLGPAGRDTLLATPLVVVSTRMRAHARSLGFQQVILADGANDPALLRALCAWVGH